MLRAKVLQDLSPQVRVAPPAHIPQAGARLYEARMVSCGHQHLQQGTTPLYASASVDYGRWQTGLG